MSRSAKPTDFRVDVPNVGEFVFARRTMRDEVATQVEFAKLIDGVPTPTPWLNAVCGAIADLKVLTVKAPEGWDLDALEPHDPETYTKLLGAHQGLLDKERSFRPGAAKTGEAAGAGAGQDNRVQVPPAV